MDSVDLFLVAVSVGVAMIGVWLALMAIQGGVPEASELEGPHRAGRRSGLSAS
jgi:hypothetical protein